ncbi:thiamine ABC transporter ATP-binding protein [Candidatus Liberibacter solanacearum]|uniref:Thiamin ABC transporter, ATPase component n=1 Tax=Candidatus Liberibacter solanacearum TaxID=556287 RepID=A0A095A1V9_9HYPH|nr:thiamine ABC transporter ATP-binding protein ThiQ [Candidatus Liberibacter solanacearum]KGB28041.1 thiamine ABC transporter ATP-binding protein [Candidatus Liberibacter solanacearum]KJZ80805.1 thiamine ABC transporter ATP-binding protein [Candidatus Liberibacter solanacearum]KJZ81925.1 Thiamin ABC transporter, ATPase component [Candidatus Liberibacter solanacearum]KQC49626.1 thiamine ABC transporter ATP-binding protein [Candidatus Liberibacter solanacearum]
MIKLDHLVYRYDNLEMQFDLTVNKAERVIILGLSGAGKSTLLALIAGFRYPQKGQIWLNQQNHTSSPPAKRPLSILFQENNLFPHLTVWQNIALGLSPHLHLDQDQRAQVQQIIEQFYLNDCLNRFPSQMSGGQCQRVALARCLIRKKPILLLDEPFSGFDPALRYEILALLKKICDERQLTLLMITHNLDDAVQIATRSIVVAEGKIVYDGYPDRLVNGLTLESILLGISSHC